MGFWTSQGKGKIAMDGERNITYGLRRWVPRGKCTVVQKLNGHDVNEYDGYDYGTHFVLVPRRRSSPAACQSKDIRLILSM